MTAFLNYIVSQAIISLTWCYQLSEAKYLSSREESQATVHKCLFFFFFFFPYVASFGQRDKQSFKHTDFKVALLLTNSKGACLSVQFIPQHNILCSAPGYRNWPCFYSTTCSDPFKVRKELNLNVLRSGWIVTLNDRRRSPFLGAF